MRISFFVLVFLAFSNIFAQKDDSSMVYEVVECSNDIFYDYTFIILNNYDEEVYYYVITNKDELNDTTHYEKLKKGMFIRLSLIKAEKNKSIKVIPLHRNNRFTVPVVREHQYIVRHNKAMVDVYYCNNIIGVFVDKKCVINKPPQRVYMYKR